MLLLQFLPQPFPLLRWSPLFLSSDCCLRKGAVPRHGVDAAAFGAQELQQELRPVWPACGAGSGVEGKLACRKPLCLLVRLWARHCSRASTEG